MTPNKKIEILALRHKLWVHFCRQRLGDRNGMYAEDVVQTAYVNLLLFLRKNPEMVITNSYMYAVLRNIMTKDARGHDPLEKATRLIGDIPDEEQKAAKPNYSELKPEIDKVVENFYVFDKNLFNAYRYEFTSIRKLSKVTRIGQRQVFQTVKKCKEKINNQLKYKYYGKEE